MTKEEAISAMQDGKPVTHYLFEHNEFIWMKEGVIYDEEFHCLDWGEKLNFWTDRQGEIWQTGWKLKFI